MAPAEPQGGIFGFVVKTIRGMDHRGERRRAWAAVALALFGEELEEIIDAGRDAEGWRVVRLRTRWRPPGYAEEPRSPTPPRRTRRT